MSARARKHSNGWPAVREFRHHLDSPVGLVEVCGSVRWVLRVMLQLPGNVWGDDALACRNDHLMARSLVLHACFPAQR
jgi:hypothetical protein